MKILSAAIGLNLAVLGLVGCAGDAANNSAATTKPNTAVVNANVNPPKNPNLSNTTSRITTTDAFFPEAAIGGLAEVEMSKIAATKAKDPEVKKFAQQMVAEHTRVNSELKALAAKKNITLPTELDAGHKALAEKLKSLDGADFDKAYMEGQNADHERTVNLFQRQVDGGADPEVKAFAAKMLPDLNKHLETAAQLNKRIQQ